MKKIIIAAALLCVGFIAKAQYNYSQWGVGLTYGTLLPYSDTKINHETRGGALSAYWNFSPYVPIALDIMKGTLSGGDNVLDPYHRYWKNEFTSANLRIDVQLGELVDYDNSFVLRRLKGVYMGTGIGVLINNITDIRRYDLLDPTYKFPGSDHTIDMLVPLRIGYEFKIYNYDEEPFMCVDIGYSHYLTFGEGMDGYEDPSNHFKNNAPDMFRAITVGVKFNFGFPVSYFKSIK